MLLLLLLLGVDSVSLKLSFKLFELCICMYVQVRRLGWILERMSPGTWCCLPRKRGPPRLRVLHTPEGLSGSLRDRDLP